MEYEMEDSYFSNPSQDKDQKKVIRYYTLKNFLNHLGTSKTGKYEEPVPLDPCGELENTSSSNGNATNGGSRGYSDPNAPTNMNSNSYVNVGYYNYYGGGGSKGTVEVGQGYFGRPSNAQKRNNKSGKTSDTDCPIDEILIPVNILRIINNLKEGSKEECEHDALTKKGSSFVKNLLSSFMGESEFNIKIVSKDKVFVQDTGLEVNGRISHPLNGLMTITISTGRANKKPALSVACTILHEYIHADIFGKLNTIANTPEILNFRETYNIYESKIFKSTAQHNTMADLYIGKMKKALKDFHKNALPKDYAYLSNNGTKSLDDFYEALAWEGLKIDKVEAWNTMPDLRKKVLEDALQENIFSATKTFPKIK